MAVLEPVAIKEHPAAVKGVRKIYVRGNQLPQERYMKDCMPGNSLAQGGWGSGKTYAGSRKLATLHYHNKCKGFIVAPTWADVGRIQVPALLQTFTEWGAACEFWPSGHGNNRFPHMIAFGQIIYMFSGDSPGRIVGFEAGHGWGDEAARFKVSAQDPTEDTPTQIRGRLRDTRARSLHWTDTTTPEGLDTYVQRNYIDKPMKDHRSYFLPTVGNKALPQQYIDNLLSTIPLALQAQYLLGQAVNYAANRAHPNFDKSYSLMDVRWSPSKPVHIGCDFNVSPMAWVAGQFLDDGRYVVIDELIISDHAQVDVMVHQAVARGWFHSTVGNIVVPRQAVIHPDKASKNRSTTGDPEFTVLLETARNLGCRVTGNCDGANPPIAGRINNVERLFLSANRIAKLLIHPRCVVLINELSRTARLPNGAYDPGPDKKLGHILDGLGYKLWDLFPIAAPIEYQRGI
jgi:hypothetical protein